MTPRRPTRIVGEPHDEFWRRCESRALYIQRCAKCGDLVWPARDRCGCAAEAPLTWVAMSGHGQVVATCTFERQYYDECPTPWPIIVVRLDEGPLFVSNPHPDATWPIDRGTRVEVDFVAVHDKHGGFALPVFRASALAGVHSIPVSP